MEHLKLTPLFTRERIEAEVRRVAGEINRDFQGKPVVLVGVLKGALLFLADLVRHLDLDVQIDFVRLASYGSETISSGLVELRKDLELSLRDRHVIVVEDILDSGHTLEFLCTRLLQQEPQSLHVCTLIDKRARRESAVEPDYVGLVMDDGFIVGYGLDLDERYRHLPEIYLVHNES